MTTGTDLIAAERQRQIDAEGWTPEHDRQLRDGSLAWAAVAYALVPTVALGDYDRMSFWPWDLAYYKPTPDDRVRELVKAGALIAAEIDRLRAEDEPEGPEWIDAQADAAPSRSGDSPTPPTEETRDARSS